MVSLRWLLAACLWLSACASAPPDPGAFPGVEGARLFKAKGCITCHTIGDGVKVGHDLIGLFGRREEAWIRRYLSDPVAMVEQDPVAQGLKAQYKIQMPKMMISPTEMDQLLAYLRQATLPTKP